MLAMCCVTMFSALENAAASANRIVTTAPAAAAQSSPLGPCTPTRGRTCAPARRRSRRRRAAVPGPPGRSGCRCRPRGRRALPSLYARRPPPAWRPGTSTRASSAKTRSWASAGAMWWSMWNEAAPVKRSGGKSERRRVADHDFDVAAGHPLGQRRRQALVELDRGEVRRLGAQDVGREPGPGTDLDRVVAEVHAAQRHGEDRLVDEPRQSSLAQYSMWPGVHGATLSPAPGPGTRPSTSVRCGPLRGRCAARGPARGPPGVGPMRSATGRRASRSKS